MHCSVKHFTPEWMSNQQLIVGVYRCGRTIYGILDLQAVVCQSCDSQSKITKKWISGMTNLWERKLCVMIVRISELTRSVTEASV